MLTAHTSVSALSGGVVATVVHLEDEAGPVAAVQITAPDEPMSIEAVGALGADLVALAATLGGSA